jgi:SAM-dependent methyltransferase
MVQEPIEAVWDRFMGIYVASSTRTVVSELAKKILALLFDAKWFDLTAIALNALHIMSEPEKAPKEFRRILRPIWNYFNKIGGWIKYVQKEKRLHF